MAEGHAVIRWARNLRVLVGEKLVDVHLPKRWDEQVADLIGQQITVVETHGKILLLKLSGGETLLCHAMQYGSWQVGEPGMKLRKDAKYVRLRLVTEQHEAVFYHGPIIELLTEDELAHNNRLQALGPDVMKEDFDRDEIWRRLQTFPTEPIGDLVINQRVMAGVGNIFKSEGLFLAGINPCLTPPQLEQADLDRFLDRTIPLMWEATKTYGPTKTLPPELQKSTGAKNWVYGRKGKPCFVCETPIEKITQGQSARATYFCPVCQPAKSD